MIKSLIKRLKYVGKFNNQKRWFEGNNKSEYKDYLNQKEFENLFSTN